MPTIAGVAAGACLWKAGLVALYLVLCPATSAGQDSVVSIYRFVLGVDVPDSPSLVALGLAPSHVLRGSAPKPLAAMLVATALPDSGRSTALSVDFSPYFLVGGGRRPLASYRSNSVAGRLLRVLTKTILSFGAARVSDSDATLLGVGLRSTIHDPHDPVLNSSLPEQVAAALARSGVSVDGGDEDGRGGGGGPPSHVRPRAPRHACPFG